MRRAVVAGLLMAVTVVGCSSGTAQQAASSGSAAGTTAAGERATIGLTYIPNVQFAPAYLAADEHRFGSTSVELRHHGAQEGLFTALTSGQENFVVAGGDEMLQARAQGADLVAVASYYSRFPAEVIARADSGITKLADLKGRSVGVPGRYGESWFGLLVALQSAGLSQSDVKISEIGYTGQAAVATKKVDAIVGFSNNDAVALKTGGTDITEIPVGSDVPLVSTVVVTTRDMIAKHPTVVRDVAQGIVAGMQRTTESPDAAIEATKKRVPDLAQPEQEKAARATLTATIPLFAGADGRVTGSLDTATWDRMSQFMLEQKLIAKAVPAAEAVDTTFVTPRR